jgi:hypothetical protein
MRLLKLVIAVGALALGLPMAAQANGPNYVPGGPNYQPQGPPPHGKAFGYFCRGESKKHVKGQKGTPFSQCVKAMARANRNDRMPPGRACRGLSKKHAKGQKGTAFSRCVKGVAKMRAGVRYEAGPMVFGPNGWGGWSCPAGTEVIGGGYEPASATVLFSAAAKPGEAMYPNYPHHVFEAGETGWVVQNDNDQETINVFVICR